MKLEIEISTKVVQIIFWGNLFTRNNVEPTFTRGGWNNVTYVRLHQRWNNVTLLTFNQRWNKVGWNYVKIITLNHRWKKVSWNNVARETLMEGVINVSTFFTFYQPLWNVE